MTQYTKAIVAAVSTVVALVVAIARQDAADTIPGATETLIGVLTTILVYALPNQTPKPPG